MPCLGPVDVPGANPIRDGYAILFEDGRKPHWVPAARFEAEFTPMDAMSFPAALALLMAGKRIARAAWRDGVLRGDGEAVLLELGDGARHVWRPAGFDMFALDWRIVE